MPDYAYINTRIRSMEAELLGKGQLSELVSFRDLSSAVTYLKKTAYGIYFPERGEETLIYKIDTAVRTSISASMRKVIGFYERSKSRGIRGGDESTLIEILLGRWDVFNIKTLIRGKANQTPSKETLSATVPAGTLHEAILQEVYKQPAVQAIVDMLFTIGISYVSPLRKLKYLHEGDLFSGEVELDKAFFAHSLRRLETSAENGTDRLMVENISRMLIDKYNLVTAVKVAEAGLHTVKGTDEADTYFIKGGRMISSAVFKKIIKGKDISEYISAIDSPVWKSHWETFHSRSGITSPALLVERWMDSEILGHAIRLPRKDPLNIGLVISYIWRKVNEVVNLRTILRGIHFNLPPDEIERLLITEQ